MEIALRDAVGQEITSSLLGMQGVLEASLTLWRALEEASTFSGAMQQAGAARRSKEL